MSENEELTADRQEGYAKFIRFSTWGVVVTSAIVAVVVVGFVA